LGLLLLAEGTTSVLQYAQFGTDYPRLGEARSVPIPLLTHAPIVGKSVFDQPLLTYGSVVLVVLVWLLFRRTNFGLNLRAAGEQPAALDAAGVSVVATRVWGTLAAGAFGGLGGAYLSIVGAGVFVPLMTNGQGFIALAIAILAVDRPFTALIASFVFGMALSVTSALQIAGIQVSTDLVNMIPFAAMLVALWLLARSSAMPRALGLPYMRGSA
jgi:simple sugar transport system permease protein